MSDIRLVRLAVSLLRAFGYDFNYLTRHLFEHERPAVRTIAGL